MAKTTVPPSTRLRLACLPLEDRITPVNVRFDYSLDTSGYFDSAERRAALERVATDVTKGMNDPLAPIVPSAGNVWQGRVYNTITNQVQTVNNPTVNQDEVVVYIAGGALGSGALAIASGGAYSSSGSQEWLDTVRTRGIAAVDSKTDFAPWGGMISVNTGINWDFTPGAPRPNQFDFDSVLSHEMLHIFGFGLQNPSFQRLIQNNQFTGANAMAVFGSAIPMQSNGGGEVDHFAQTVRYGGQETIMSAAIGAGVQKRMTALEYAALRDIGWSNAGGSTTSPPAAPPLSVAPAAVAVPRVPTNASVNASVNAVGSSPMTGPPNVSANATKFIVGSGDGAPSAVSGYSGSLATTEAAGGVGQGARVASGDLNGDGVNDTVIASGPGDTQIVTVISGKTGQTLYSFAPFEAGFKGGLYVAVGDVYGNGQKALAVGAGATGGPRVRVFQNGNPNWVLADFFAIDDQNFSGGVRVAFGNFNGTGAADLIASAGAGGGPRVAIYSAETLRPQNPKPTRRIGDFMAFENGLTNGTYVAAGDLNGDGRDELIIGAGERAGPRVKVYDGRSLMAGNTTTYLADFFAGDPNANIGTGVRVASADLDGDGRDDLITGVGPNGDGTVRVFLAKSLLAGLQTAATVTSKPEWVRYGAFVG